MPAAESDDNTEYLARLARGGALLDRADELRPRDNLSESVLGNISYQSEILRTGHPSAEALADTLTNAGAGFAGMFNALIMWRDPEQYALTEPYMEKLITIACDPFHFACDRMGSPIPMPPGAPRLLTREVAGPVLVSDLLVRRGEALLRRADTVPATRMADLGEAMQRLQVAKALLGTAQKNSQDPALAHYPFSANLPPREQRLQGLIDATQARLTGTTPPPALPSGDFYRSRDYRLVYQCAGCHTRGPASTEVPQ